LSTKIVIFADLDGTILNASYNFAEIQPIIENLKQLNVAIILNSSKTKQEMIYYKNKLRINEPFIAENGSAIYIPKNYFNIQYNFTKKTSFYNVIELGLDYATIRKNLKRIKKKNNAKILGFGDMTPEEVSRDTNLPVHLACKAKKREYDEAFKIIEGNPTTILESIKDQGLNHTKGGRYYHILGNTDKGKAANNLKQLYLKEYTKIVTIAVGDSQNDQPMLKIVNKPFMLDENILLVWKKILETVKTYSLTA